MKTNNRRNFVKKSIIGISGAALLPSVLPHTFRENKKDIPSLPDRPLGKTGIGTPLISLGTSGVTDPGFIKAAYEAGVKLFFSATYYGEGNNEILVGRGLKGLPRDSFVVGTAAVPDELNKRTWTFTSEFTSSKFMKTAENSLTRFGLDHIDIVLLPFAGKKEMVLHEGVLKTFDLLKRQGKVRFVGIASHSDSAEALDAAAGSGVYDVAMIGYNFKTQDIEKLNSSIDRAFKAGIGIVAMKTTAGAFDNKSGPAINSDAALKWVLRNEEIASIVSGMTTFEQLQKNLNMIRNLKMTEQEQKDLKIAAEFSSTGLYCQQCKKCLPQCPHNLDIPTIMRSYMYAYGYKNLQQAWYTLKDAGLSGIPPCDKCESCNVSCASRFDVRSKIKDIARIGSVPSDLIKA